jgi:glycosyltransferase involved in cell wall biosynthesis
MPAASHLTFTVLLPVHRPPAMLPYAIESVLAQSRQDFELVVICDGAPQETVDCARAFAARDARIQVRAHPKGERIGEAYRHEALAQARGKYVCQIADDDLWFPEHLSEMEILLREFEFGNLAEVHVRPEGGLYLQVGDLGNARIRKAMRTQTFNFFGPSAVGYRLATYRRMPVGWSPAPPEERWSDLYMWRKFLALPELVCGSRVAITGVHFPTSTRRDWPLEQRGEEVRTWAERIQDPAARDRMTQHLLRQLMAAEFRQRLQARKEKRA